LRSPAEPRRHPSQILSWADPAYLRRFQDDIAGLYDGKRLSGGKSAPGCGISAANLPRPH